MSIPYSNAVWELQIATTHKIVLLALANHANDYGECFPSVNRLVKMTCLSKRSVIKSINYLIINNLIFADRRAGRNSNYCLTDPKKWSESIINQPIKDTNLDDTGALRAPVQEMHQCTDCKNEEGVVHHVHLTGAPRAPVIINKPSIKKQPSINNKNLVDQFDAMSYLISKGVDKQVALDWLKIRKVKKSPPTLTAFGQVEKEAVKAGLSFADAVSYACARGWVGFNAAWCQNNNNQYNQRNKLNQTQINQDLSFSDYLTQRRDQDNANIIDITPSRTH
jgi:hypothetical protein